MKAYVELIQRKERAIGCDVLTHQKVCPAVLSKGLSLTTVVVVRRRLCRLNDDDRHWRHVSPRRFLRPEPLTNWDSSSTAAMGKGVTESQFVDDKTKKALGNL